MKSKITYLKHDTDRMSRPDKIKPNTDTSTNQDCQYQFFPGRIKKQAI